MIHDRRSKWLKSSWTVLTRKLTTTSMVAADYIKWHESRSQIGISYISPRWRSTREIPSLWGTWGKGLPSGRSLILIAVDSPLKIGWCYHWISGGREVLVGSPIKIRRHHRAHPRSQTSRVSRSQATIIEINWKYLPLYKENIPHQIKRAVAMIMPVP